MRCISLLHNGDRKGKFQETTHLGQGVSAGRREAEPAVEVMKLEDESFDFTMRGKRRVNVTGLSR